MDRINTVLQRYLPAGTSGIFTDWIYEYRIHLHIKRNRVTKAGDYRPPIPSDPRHRISINHNLNPYAFLLTLAHELAHRVVFEKYSRNVKPHGKEWQHEFRLLMEPFLNEKVFPAGLLPAVSAYMGKISASSSTDHMLSKALSRYDDSRNAETVFVDELQEGTLFKLGADRVFQKGPRQRTRYRCVCMNNKKIYLVNGNAPVIPVK